MDYRQRYAMKRNFQVLLQECSIRSQVDDLLDRMFSNILLEKDEYEILIRMTLSKEKMRTLISLMLDKRGAKYEKLYEVFLDGLRLDFQRPDVVQKLQDAYRKSPAVDSDAKSISSEEIHTSGTSLDSNHALQNNTYTYNNYFYSCPTLPNIPYIDDNPTRLSINEDTPPPRKSSLDSVLSSINPDHGNPTLQLIHEGHSHPRRLILDSVVTSSINPDRGHGNHTLKSIHENSPQPRRLSLDSQLAPPTSLDHIHLIGARSRQTSARTHRNRYKIEQKVDTSEPNSAASSVETAVCGNPEFQYNIVILGAVGVGKSSLLSRYMRQGFNQLEFEATNVNVGPVEKFIELETKIIKLVIRDTVGQQLFGPKEIPFCADIDGAIIVFDVTSMESVLDLVKWHDQIKSQASDQIKCILVGNKTDLQPRRVTPTQAKMMAGHFGIQTYFETSAKVDRGVDEIFLSLAKQILERNEDSIAHKHKHVTIKRARRKNCSIL